MIVSKHAIVQYKKRFGRKTSSGHRVAGHIRKEISSHRESSRINCTGSLEIITREFRAIVHHGTVITVTSKERTSKSLSVLLEEANTIAVSL